MPTPQEKLAESLRALKALQDRHVVAIRSSELSRVHRERLMRNGFLKEVIKGWYIPAQPGEEPGDTTPWYTSFWDFCSAYLRERFGNQWCVGPEQSLSLLAGNRAVPPQLLVRSPKGGNKPQALLHGTSIFDIRAMLPPEAETIEQDGLRLYAPATALIAASPTFFNTRPTDVRTILSLMMQPSELLVQLLEGGHSTIAGRLAGAFRNIGRPRIADEIVSAMRAAGYAVREEDPFDEKIVLSLPRHETSPYASRIRLMWQSMRQAIEENFPPSPQTLPSPESHLKGMDDAYVADAYNSLSIEGYKVSPALIERVSGGGWNPDGDSNDRKQKDAMAARGYYLAFESVKQSVLRVLAKEDAGTVADEDHRTWYQALFGPSVEAGLLQPGDLAGYRRDRVFIRRSLHVPLPPNAIGEAMSAFFEMLETEKSPAVRAVLGHFVFVYIHPYMDGNGRMGRFMMNLMLASGGYPWTVVPLERRKQYMAALEDASVKQDIAPFTHFLSDLVAQSLAGNPIATIPKE